ncbi:hypothetical protein SCUP234_01025 [Seiridium cupressi]
MSLIFATFKVMDPPRRMWVDPWEARYDSKPASGDDELSAKQLPIESGANPEHCVSGYDGEETAMGKQPKPNSDHFSRETSVRITVDTITSTHSTVSTRVACMSTNSSRPRNQLNESRWATGKKARGCTAAKGDRASSSSKTVPSNEQHADHPQVHGQPRTSVHPQQLAKPVQITLQDRTDLEENAQYVPPHLRQDLAGHVLSPPSKTTVSITSDHGAIDHRHENVLDDSSSQYRKLATTGDGDDLSAAQPTKSALTPSPTLSHHADESLENNRPALRDTSPGFDHSTDGAGRAQQVAQNPVTSNLSKLAPHLRSLHAKIAAGQIRPKFERSNSQHSQSGAIAESAQSIPAVRTQSATALTTQALHSIEMMQKNAIMVEDASLSSNACRGTPITSLDDSLTFEDANDSDFDPNTMIKDMRGEEPRETWDNQDWNATRRARPKRKDWESETNVSDISNESERSAFARPDTFLHRFVRTWLEHVPRVEGNLFSVSAAHTSEHHGINPVNYRALSPIKAAKTIQYRYGVDDFRIQDKAQNQTANQSTERWLKQRETEKAQEQRRQRELEIKQQQLEMAEAKAKKRNPFLCRVPAYFRPAAEGDMKDVARIYNQEVCQGWRALDQESQTVAAFTQLLQLSRVEKIPFVVAMSEYRNPNIPIHEADHRVIGFAFLDVASRGVFGSTKSNGKHSAKMFVMVDPDFRRHRVGTALIDRVLIITSRGYLPKELSYQFENPDHDPTYNPELYNPRQWRTVQLEIFIQNLGNVATTIEGDEFKFIRDWLRIDFQFTLDMHTSNYGIADRHGQMLLDRVVFEHRCGDSDRNWDPQD